MGARTSHSAGTFSWAELVTPDVKTAKEFYGSLFGWTLEDLAVGDGETYTIFRKDGKAVAGCYASGAEQSGMPPLWISHVTVDSADSAAARAGELGGSVIDEPFDIPDTGRMCTIADPEGATFVAWEPKGFIGAELVNEDGAVSWNELRTRNTDQARAFYEGLLGWDFEAFDMGGGLSYVTLMVGKRENGGMIPILPSVEGVPAHWGVYFVANDLEASVEKVTELGGQVIVPPMHAPSSETGRMSIALDPQGASFSLFSGHLDD